MSAGDAGPRNGRQPKTTGPGVQHVTVDPEWAGQRLDNFLMARLRDVPKSVVYRVIRKGEVRVNRSRARPNYRVAGGDVIRIPPVRSARSEAPEKPLPGKRVQQLINRAVLEETATYLLVNKPAGMASHGGSGVDFGLIEVLRAARPQDRYLELVHRLDRDTSGIMLVARRRSALRDLQDQMRHRTIGKRYRALVAGDWPDGLNDVSVPLLRVESPSGERLVRPDTEQGKSARTRFRVLERFSGYTLVEAEPLTGRTHQIRVHTACQGHPIAGDAKYMDDAARSAFARIGGDRLMLHAHALGFAEPGSDSFQPQWHEAPAEPVFQRMLNRLRERENK